MDKGPWNVGIRCVASDDFTRDVALRISGDFATDADESAYARWLADVLNGAAELRRKDEQIAEITERLNTAADVAMLMSKERAEFKAERDALAALMDEALDLAEETDLSNEAINRTADWLIRAKAARGK